MNDSTTGGFLAPTGAPPLEGKALTEFLQGLVVGITGLDGTMVRPRWQAEPPNVPDAGEAWAALGISVKHPDTNAYVNFKPKTETYVFQRNATIEVLVSFYDLGTNGLADQYAGLWRDGLQVPQNLETLLDADLGFVETQDAVVVPTLLKTRWQYRVDVLTVFRQLVERTYPVVSIVEADGTLEANDGQNILTRTITAK